MDYSFKVSLGALPALAKTGSYPAAWTEEDEAVKSYLGAGNGLSEWCEKSLAEFKFVRWDRLTFTKKPGGPHMITCYGWIDRKSDTYKDFVVLHLVLESREVVYGISSSAERDPEIAELCARLSSVKSYGMKKCTRVEDVFAIPNMIKLRVEKDGNAD